MPVRAEDTEKAVILLIEVSRNNQQALLEVLQEYITSSGDGTDQESDESDQVNNIEESIEVVDADNQFHLQGKINSLYNL